MPSAARAFVFRGEQTPVLGARASLPRRGSLRGDQAAIVQSERTGKIGAPSCHPLPGTFSALVCTACLPFGIASSSAASGARGDGDSVVLHDTWLCWLFCGL